MNDTLLHAPLVERNTFMVVDPNDPKKTIPVVFASFAACIERRARVAENRTNQLEATLKGYTL